MTRARLIVIYDSIKFKTKGIVSICQFSTCGHCLCATSTGSFRHRQSINSHLQSSKWCHRIFRSSRIPTHLSSVIFRLTRARIKLKLIERWPFARRDRRDILSCPRMLLFLLEQMDMWQTTLFLYWNPMLETRQRCHACTYV